VDDPHNIYALLGKVLQDIQPVGKNQRNDTQNYDFRGIDDIFGSVNPAMAKHGLSMTFRVIDIERVEVSSSRGAKGYNTLVHVEYVFHAPDGSSVSVRTCGESISYDDKGFNKALQAALKYALIQMFLIPVAEPEADHMTPEMVAHPEPVQWASKPELDYLTNISRGLSDVSVELARKKRQELGIGPFKEGVLKDKYDELVEFVEDLLGAQTEEPFLEEAKEEEDIVQIPRSSPDP